MVLGPHRGAGNGGERKNVHKLGGDEEGRLNWRRSSLGIRSSRWRVISGRLRAMKWKGLDQVKSGARDRFD